MTVKGDAAAEALVWHGELVCVAKVSLGFVHHPDRVDVGPETFIDFETLRSEIDFWLVNKLWYGAEVRLVVSQVVGVDNRQVINTNHSWARGPGTGAATHDVTGIASDGVPGVTSCDVTGATTHEVTCVARCEVTGVARCANTRAARRANASAARHGVTGVARCDVTGAAGCSITGVTKRDVTGALTHDVIRAASCKRCSSFRYVWKSFIFIYFLFYIEREQVSLSIIIVTKFHISITIKRVNNKYKSKLTKMIWRK